MILFFKVSLDFINDFIFIVVNVVFLYVDERSVFLLIYNLILNIVNDMFIYSLMIEQINGLLFENNLLDFIIDNVIEFDFEVFVNMDIDNQVNFGIGIFINIFIIVVWGMIDVIYMYEILMVIVFVFNMFGIFGLILVGLVVIRSCVK